MTDLVAGVVPSARPPASLRHARIRANPGLTLIPFASLSDEERAGFGSLSNDPEQHGVADIAAGAGDGDVDGRRRRAGGRNDVLLEPVQVRPTGTGRAISEPNTAPAPPPGPGTVRGDGSGRRRHGRCRLDECRYNNAGRTIYAGETRRPVGT